MAEVLITAMRSVLACAFLCLPFVIARAFLCLLVLLLRLVVPHIKNQQKQSNMDPESTNNRPKIDQKSTQHGSKIGPRSIQRDLGGLRQVLRGSWVGLGEGSGESWRVLGGLGGGSGGSKID